MGGVLYVVATPIGNLGDLSQRALDTLRAVDVIFCEDTRVTRRLAEKFEIPTPLESYHQHSPLGKIARIIRLLREGKNLALVTDAGTPGITDPGNWLIHEIVRALPEARVSPIPGASAAIAALSISGFSTDQFYFCGFPPAKKRRTAFFRDALERKETVVLYESSHRILKTLDDLTAQGGSSRSCMVARELTKLYETIYRGTVGEVSQRLHKERARGEYVIVLEKSTPAPKLKSLSFRNV